MNENELKLVNVLNGTLSLGHRPKVKILKQYKHYGISHIWTLLSEKEGALDIRQAVLNTGLEWVWLPLANGKEPEIDRLKEIEICFNICKELLNSGANIHIVVFCRYTQNWNDFIRISSPSWLLWR
jgi:hypothetical protein